MNSVVWSESAWLCTWFYYRHRSGVGNKNQRTDSSVIVPYVHRHHTVCHWLVRGHVVQVERDQCVTEWPANSSACFCFERAFTFINSPLKWSLKRSKSNEVGPKTKKDKKRNNSNLSGLCAVKIVRWYCFGNMDTIVSTWFSWWPSL